MIKEQTLIQAYRIAQERYAEFGVDVEAAMKELEDDSRLAPLLAGRRCRRI